MDPVLLALTQKQLDHITRQMGWVMMKTARSPIFSQSHDFSCFIADADGSVAAQADGPHEIVFRRPAVAFDSQPRSRHPRFFAEPHRGAEEDMTTWAQCHDAGIGEQSGEHGQLDARDRGASKHSANAGVARFGLGQALSPNP